RCNWARGKVLGGSSAINFLMHVRGNRRDFDLWEIQHGAFNWSYMGVLPYFKKSEHYMGPNPDRRYRGIKGKVPVTFTVTQTQLVSTFLEAGRVLGYNLIDYNGPEQAGFSRTQTTSFEGRRFSSAKSYIRPIYKKRSKNLHLCLRSRVTKVIFENNRAVGVHFVKGGIPTKSTSKAGGHSVGRRHRLDAAPPPFRSRTRERSPRAGHSCGCGPSSGQESSGPHVHGWNGGHDGRRCRTQATRYGGSERICSHKNR
ncbi:oxygen-dependent choline dehydrogenase-like, partial [Dermacentor silvarum]|uniref:oxygen-dependent choline dehydrogenase-like n=1 Tax=Dermacentor silvarum TaxID=543639 RepID=UPI002101CA18